MESTPDINALIQQTISLECSEDTATNTKPIYNEFAIITKILSEKQINMAAFKTTILKAWNPKKKVHINQLEPNVMAFIFEDETDALKIMNLSWSFRDMQIIIQKWPPDKSLNDIDLTKTLFWIQATNIPVYLISPATATTIGNLVGKFVKTDQHSPTQRWKKCLRIQVELDILKPMTSFISLPIQGKPDLLIEIRYERLSEFCYYCGVLGHKFLTCSLATGLESVNISSCEFGPWMKSENTHILNPHLTKTLHVKQPFQTSSLGKCAFTHIPNNPTNPEYHKYMNSINGGEKISPESLSGDTLQKKLAGNASQSHLGKSHLDTNVAIPDWLGKSDLQKKDLTIPFAANVKIQQPPSLTQNSKFSNDSIQKADNSEPLDKKHIIIPHFPLISDQTMPDLIGPSKSTFNQAHPFTFEPIRKGPNPNHWANLSSATFEFQPNPGNYSIPKPSPIVERTLTNLKRDCSLISATSPNSSSENKKLKCDFSNFAALSLNSSDRSTNQTTITEPEPNFDPSLTSVPIIEINTDSMPKLFFRNKIYTLTRSRTGNPILHRSSTSSVIITDFEDEDSSSNHPSTDLENTPSHLIKNEPPNSYGPKGSRK